MLEIALDRLTLYNMEKGPAEDYKEYAIRWKNVASTVRPPLTSREENSMFVDTLPSPYYDMLIVNTFVEFRRVLFRSPSCYNTWPNGSQGIWFHRTFQILAF